MTKLDSLMVMIMAIQSGIKWARGHTYIIIIWKTMLNNLHNLPNLNTTLPKVKNGKSFCYILEGIKIAFDL